MAGNLNVLEQLNELEIKLWDKQDSFWKTVFAGLSGFWGVIVPLSLSKDIDGGARTWLLFAALCAFAASLCLIPVMWQSSRRLNDLIGAGKRFLRQEALSGGVREFSPLPAMRCEKSCIAFSCLFVVAILVCLCVSVCITQG